MAYRLIAFFMFAVFMGGCNSSPEDLLIGRWNYDRMENDPNGAVQYDDFTQVMMKRVNSGKYYEFYNDGTCETGAALGLSTLFSDYEMEADGRTVNFYQNGTIVQVPITIVKITKTEMWLEQGGQTAMVFVRQ